MSHIEIKNKRIIVINFLILFSFICYSQDDSIVSKTYTNSYIQWISQFPSLLEDSDNKTFIKSFTDILFGKEKLTLNKPISVFATHPDSLWIMDQGNNLILEVKGKNIETSDDFKKESKQFTSLLGICSYKNNNLLFTDSRDNKIYALSTKSKEVNCFNDSLKLKQPTGIAYSTVTDEIWVVETAEHRISILDSNGNILQKIGKRGSKEGEFNFPTSIWIDKSGIAYIVDALNYRIQIFDRKGNFISMFGKIGDSSGYFARPKGIAIDSQGNIYISDALFHVIQIFDIQGNYLYSFGSQGKEKEEFWMPAGIFIDDNDYIYVADSYNARVQIFKFIK